MFKISPRYFMRRRELLRCVRCRDFARGLEIARQLKDREMISLIAACRVKQLLEEAVHAQD